jgi:hypothetical protein
MNLLLRCLPLAVLALLAVCGSASAQLGGASTAQVVSACGTPIGTYAAGNIKPLTQTAGGLLCSSGGGGGGGNVTIVAPLGSQTAAASVAVTCNSGCSGGPADESAFTFGTTAIFTGGVYQTTATSNALTTGQAGVVQMTANRAFFVNLRNSSGAELGIAAAPLQVSLANTAANGTAVLVTGTGGSFPIPANSSVNLTQVGGSAVALGQTTMSASVPVAIASNQSNVPVSQATASALNATVVGTGTFAVQATLNATPSLANGNGVVPTQGGAVLSATNGGYTNLLQGNAVLATGNPLFAQLTAGSAIAGKVGIDQTTAGTTNGVAVVGVNAATALAGAGATGTGSLRVTAAQDTTTIAGSAPGTAGTPSTNVVSIQGVSSGTVVPVSGTVTNNNAVNVTPTDCSGTITTGGTAQNAFTAQTTLHGFTIANIDATTGSGEVLNISFTTTAAAATAGSYPLAAPTATTLANLSSFTAPPGFGLNHALSVIAATTGHKYSCTWW